MKVEELRIGNLVYAKSFDGFTPKVYSEVIGVAKTDKVLLATLGRANVSEPIEDVSPIHLTAEWLTEFGFDEPQNREGIFIKGRLQVAKGLGSMCYLIEEDTLKAHWIPVELKYVHQLQNLYYALTGEELIEATKTPPITHSFPDNKSLRERVIKQTGYGFDGCTICCSEWMRSPNMERAEHKKDCIAYPQGQ